MFDVHTLPSSESLPIHTDQFLMKERALVPIFSLELSVSFVSGGTVALRNKLVASGVELDSPQSIYRCRSRKADAYKLAKKCISENGIDFPISVPGQFNDSNSIGHAELTWFSVGDVRANDVSYILKYDAKPPDSPDDFCTKVHALLRIDKPREAQSLLRSCLSSVVEITWS